MDGDGYRGKDTRPHTAVSLLMSKLGFEKQDYTVFFLNEGLVFCGIYRV